MPAKRAILIFLEMRHFDSRSTTRYPLESTLSYPSLNLGEGVTPLETDEYFLPGNWIEGLFPVPVGHCILSSPLAKRQFAGLGFTGENAAACVIFVHY